MHFCNGNVFCQHSFIIQVESPQRLLTIKHLLEAVDAPVDSKVLLRAIFKASGDRAAKKKTANWPWSMQLPCRVCSDAAATAGDADEKTYPLEAFLNSLDGLESVV